MDPMQTIDQANAELEGRQTQTIDQANAELEGRPTQTIEQANAELEGRPTQTIEQANAELEGRKPVIADDGDKLLNPAMETAKAAWEGAKNTVTSVLNPALKLIGDAARGLGNISANGIVMPNGMVIGGTGRLGGDETDPDKIAQMRRDSFGNVVGDKADEWIDTILPYEKSDDAVAGAIQTVGEKVGNLARFMKAGAGTLMVANFGQQWNQHYDEYIAAGRSPAEAAAYADAGGAAGATFDAALKAIPVTHFLKKGFGYNEANSGIKELLKKLGDIGAQEVRGVVGKEVAKDVLANMAFEAMSFGGISAVQTFVDNCIEQQGATGEIDAKQALSAAFDAGMHGAVEGAVMGGLMSTPKAVDMVKAGKGAVQAKKAKAARIEAERVQSEKDAHAAAEAARIAAEEEKVAKEQQRVAASELRGKENVAEQMAGIEEMGVRNWEEAEAKGLTEKDETGAYRGGARQALNIAIHGTDKLKGAVKSGAMSGDTAEAILTTAQCELGARPVEDRAALVDAIVDKAGGDEALAKGILRKLTAEEVADGAATAEPLGAEAIEARVERAAEQVKAEAIAARNGVDEATARSVSVEPVETADGRLTTVGDQVAAESADGKVATKPQTALEGFENAERLKGTELKVTDNGTMTCNTFPELRLDVSQDGVSVRGITPETMAKPENAADAAAVVARAYQVAKRNGVKLVFESEEAAKTAAGLMVEVQREGLALTQKRLDTRAKVLDTLLGSGLGTHVTFDMGNFKKALEASGTGRRFINQAGDIYAFEDGKGGIHFNPQHLRMDTPFHEYGHLARAVVEKVNPSLWKRGTDLIGETEYFREIAEMAKGEKHPYHGLDEAALREEAICNLLGDRGAKIIESKGAGAELKKWIREFWKAIKDALGIADLTEEQIEKMTLEEIADAVNSELLRGREFGKRTKPSGLSRRQAALKRMQGQEDAYWEQKAEAEEEAARQAYIASGGTAMDYVKSRATESEAPLDLNWEAMRELANDIAEGRFAAKGRVMDDAARKRKERRIKELQIEGAIISKRNHRPTIDDYIEWIKAGEIDVEYEKKLAKASGITIETDRWIAEQCLREYDKETAKLEKELKELRETPIEGENGQLEFRFQAMKPEEIDMSLFTWKKPGENDLAMGDREQKPAGIAAGIEKKEALRPWTKKMSPADQAKPIAFDAADMVMLWRAVSGSLRNPVIKNGYEIPGRPGAIGVNRGGNFIELASKLFGVIDAGDIERMRKGLKSEGMFRHLDPAWRANQSKLSIRTEQERSEAELDKRTRALYEKRVTTGEGGEHYATQVLGHEIGHTLAKMPPDKNLGPIGNDLKTLFEAMKGRMLRHKDPLMKKGDVSAMEQVRQLIAWWHGTEKMPEYYEKPEERFAELFGIFLTQPESVQSMAPKAYDICVDAIANNEKLTKAYRHVAELKWKGQSNDAVMKRLRATWEADAQKQYRKLADETKESVSSWKDAFNYALNDRFGPLFGISKRGIKAEKARLDQAVKEGKMSEQEAADRLGDMKAETDAMRTSLYNWQRQSGGSTRLMISHFDEVKYNAEKAGVSWEDVRDYAHLMRVIEVGGRATAHGIDPARAAAILGDMARRLGPEKWAGVEKTAKAFRACYESDVLDDPNVKELFDEMTNKMLAENKHYVTMKHRMGVEEAADWQKRIEEYRKGNRDAWDPCIDIQTRLNKGLGGAGGEGGGGFVLHRLVGSFEATEDPLAATIKRAIEIKEAAARNHLIKQTSETLRACGAKGVFDSVVKNGGGHAVDPEVYGKLFYMDKGVKHELIVPKIVWRSFKGDPMSFGKFGEAMRFIRNTMTLWNPMFVNRAYLIDKSALEANIKGLHKPIVDALSEALCFRGVGVPLYMFNNYLTRFTPIAKTWWGKMLWNENTVSHYAYRAQKIARMAYEGKFGEHLDEARRLRGIGENGKAAEIEQNVAICQEMLRRNVFQSQYQFNRMQKGLSTDDILRAYGYRIGGDATAKTWYGRTWEKMKAAARWANRFEEEQEAVTKIIAELYEMKRDEAAGRFGEAAAQERSRKVIEYGGTPNLSARGVAASYIENATGFFWNVRKEGALRTLRAIKDHPTEWMTKNLAQTAAPAFLKALMLTGGLEVLIRKLFDDDEDKIKKSWWAAPVIEHARWYGDAMKCIPGYYQQNYNMLPLAKFGDHVLSMRVKYSPEEFAMQNLIHVAMQKLGHDPTDPSADWSTLTNNAWNELLPDIFGSNYIADTVGTIVGPLVGINPYDDYRQRNIYDKTTWDARWSAPGHMAKEIAKNFWNYSPLGTFTTTFKNGQERNLENDDVPGWIDAVLKTPVVRMIPASMLTVTSSDSYNRALMEVDEREKAYAKIKAADVLAECIESGVLGGFEKGLGELTPQMRMIAIRHVINGWRKYNEDPRSVQIKRARAINDPKLKAKAMEWIKQAELYGD